MKDAERSSATELFGTAEQPTELTQSILTSRSKSDARPFAPAANGAAKPSRLKLTEKERKKIQELIRNAKTFAEVQRLEKDLNEGRVPAGISLDDTMDET